VACSRQMPMPDTSGRSHMLKPQALFFLDLAAMRERQTEEVRMCVDRDRERTAHTHMHTCTQVLHTQTHTHKHRHTRRRERTLFFVDMCKGEHDLVYMYPAACQHMILYAFILLYVNISTCVFLHACTLFEALFFSSLFVLCPLGVASVVVCMTLVP
jgi:hypothetical protein